MEKYNGEVLDNTAKYLAKPQQSLKDAQEFLERNLEEIMKAAAATTHDDVCDEYYTDLMMDVRLAVSEICEARAHMNAAVNSLYWAVKHAK